LALELWIAPMADINCSSLPLTSDRLKRTLLLTSADVRALSAFLWAVELMPAVEAETSSSEPA